MSKNTMKKGDYVLTPRFCTVKIDKVFKSKENAAKAGYTEPTHYQDYDFGVVGKHIGSTPITEQAVNAAKTRAAETGRDVSVIAHYQDADDREVIFHPDGTNEKIWAIDKGQRIQPVVGQVYPNRGGGLFKCIAPADDGPMFWNGAGGCSNASAVFQNVNSGWTFTAKGIIQFIDGTIEWDHSIGGHFEEVRA